MPWFLYLALKQLFPTGKKFPFFTFMSGLGVAVGVALLVISTSIMGGFGQGIRKMIVDTQGEIQVISRAPIGKPEELIDLVMKVPGVAAVSPYAQGNVALEFRNVPTFPLILGLDLARVGRVVPFDRYMTAGSFDDLDDDSVIVSQQLANSLGLQVGDRATITSYLSLQKAQQDELLLPRIVRVVGIFEIGHQQLDRSLVITSLRLMQELYGLGHAAHGLTVRLAPGSNEFKVAAEINNKLPAGMRALTWFESHEDFQSIIRFEKNMVFFLLAFIVVVAALSIMSSLTIAVVRKTREIGLIGALGGSSRDVALCYCAQGFFLGVIGTIVGLGLAWVVITYRNEIVHVLTRLTVSQEVFEQFYGFVSLPSHTAGSDLVIIIVGSIVSATFAGLLPALRAAKLKPVEALRSE